MAAEEWMTNWLRTASPLRTTIVGPPGSGKGTHGTTLADRHLVPYIDVGNVLRAEVAKGSVLGRAVQSYVQSGDLAPDGLIVSMVLEALGGTERPMRAFVLDGFPRKVSQAQRLDEWAAKVGLPLHAVVSLDVPEDELMQRLLARGRKDDTREIILNRFAVYEEETAPMLDYYRATGALMEVDGVGTPIEVARRIEAGLAGMVDRHIEGDLV